jgi:anti-sigma B factor antagonist
MKYDVKKNGKSTILTLHGRKLDATVTPELKAELLLICKPKVCNKLIIDLEEVQFCDSSGLSALLIADRTMRGHGGEVHLVHVHEKVRELMRISQLERLFSINDKADELPKK